MNFNDDDTTARKVDEVFTWVRGDVTVDEAVHKTLYVSKQWKDDNDPYPPP